MHQALYWSTLYPSNNSYTSCFYELNYSNISYKWNCIVFLTLWQAYFTYHIVACNQNFIPLKV